MYHEVSCKLCGEHLGRKHKKDVHYLYVNHFVLKHPTEWETLTTARREAEIAAKKFRELRASLGVEMTVCF